MTEKNTFTDRKELIASVMSSLMRDALECLRFIEKIEHLEKKPTKNSIIAQDAAEHYESLTDQLSDHFHDNFNAISVTYYEESKEESEEKEEREEIVC